jgi:hypothetical protein
MNKKTERQKERGRCIILCGKKIVEGWFPICLLVFRIKLTPHEKKLSYGSEPDGVKSI